MKKIILLVVLLYASSCAVQYNEAYYMADFRPYTEEGFIISPLSSYAAPYKPLATICIEFTPGYDRTNGLLDYRFEAVRPVKSNFNQVLYYRLTAFAISI